ncbi:unnamed protein product [Protopolystoma xenopodis]|uniref:Uncharacterized protein n=1 Tax=Protopolystoma xenopodis TaxID=117903 RepID=A0A3S5B0D8_9PLAT|nr:unnamed protein product [Protopolystoma xenopodis]
MTDISFKFNGIDENELEHVPLEAWSNDMSEFSIPVERSLQNSQPNSRHTAAFARVNLQTSSRDDVRTELVRFVVWWACWKPPLPHQQPLSLLHCVMRVLIFPHPSSGLWGKSNCLVVALIRSTLFTSRSLSPSLPCTLLSTPASLLPQTLFSPLATPTQCTTGSCRAHFFVWSFAR